MELAEILKPRETVDYELFSIVIHSGDAVKGHYYCYIYDEY